MYIENQKTKGSGIICCILLLRKGLKMGKSVQEICLDSGHCDPCFDCEDREECWDKSLDVYCSIINENKENKNESSSS